MTWPVRDRPDRLVWTVQANDLIGGYIVTDYPFPLSQHDHRPIGDKDKWAGGEAQAAQAAQAVNLNIERVLVVIVLVLLIVFLVQIVTR